MPGNKNYWQNVWHALRGTPIAVVSDTTPDDLPKEEAGLRSRIASLQMDIEDRDRRIETLRAEYADLRHSGRRMFAIADQSTSCVRADGLRHPSLSLKLANVPFRG